MSTNKNIEKIGIFAIILSLVSVFLLLGFTTKKEAHMQYEDLIFDTSKIHHIDIVLDDKEEFLDSCLSEKYTSCSVVIDGKAMGNVAIRGKGNTSLTSVHAMDSDRYSFKIEFDHYEEGKNYFGLDKLVLNNVIQDNTYMKDYLTYEMMREAGVNAPLCSYGIVTVNGEEHGLYLLLEAVEDSFLIRNYGNTDGNLYKPDSSEMAGGKGNGQNFMGDKNSGGNNAVKLLYTDDEISSYSEIFDNAKTDITDSDKKTLIECLKNISEKNDIEKYVDTESVIKYFAVHNFVCNGDSYTGDMIHNYYLYEDDGKLSMLPWDYNLAFGGFNGRDASSQVNFSIEYENISDRPMVSFIFSDENYKQKYYNFYYDFVSKIDTEKIISEADALISSYVEKDPTKFCTYEEYKEGVKTLTEFCNLRKESVLSQLSSEEKLIDASSINLSSMGSMNVGKGGNFESFPAYRPEGEVPDGMGEMPEIPEGEMPQITEGEMPDGQQFPEGEFSENGRPQRPDGQNFPENMGEGQFPMGNGGQFPDNINNQNAENVPTENGNNGITLFIVSILILIGGLVFVAVYKR